MQYRDCTFVWYYDVPEGSYIIFADFDLLYYSTIVYWIITIPPSLTGPSLYVTFFNWIFIGKEGHGWSVINETSRPIYATRKGHMNIDTVSTQRSSS